VVVNNRKLPGRIHTIMVSKSPLDRNYVNLNGIHVDSNLRDFSHKMVEIVKHFGYKYVSLKRNNVVEGRSWEMAAIHALMKMEGIYTGEIKSFDKKSVTFGAVLGVDVKRRLSKNIISFMDKPTMLIPQ